MIVLVCLNLILLSQSFLKISKLFKKRANRPFCSSLFSQIFYLNTPVISSLSFFCTFFTFWCQRPRNMIILFLKYSMNAKYYFKPCMWKKTCDIIKKNLHNQIITFDLKLKYYLKNIFLYINDKNVHKYRLFMNWDTTRK